MIKFTNISEGVTQASRLMLTNDGLTAAQVDAYMTTHQASLIAACGPAIGTDMRTIAAMRVTIRGYLNSNPA